jgi:hypothetical protein
MMILSDWRKIKMFRDPDIAVLLCAIGLIVAAFVGIIIVELPAIMAFIKEYAG